MNTDFILSQESDDRLKPAVALVGGSIFLTTIATLLQVRKELFVMQIDPSCPTALDELRLFNPHAVILDPVTGCEKRYEALLSEFVTHRTRPLICLEFCEDNKRLDGTLLWSTRGERPIPAMLQHEIACIESLVQAIVTTCHGLGSSGYPKE